MPPRLVILPALLAASAGCATPAPAPPSQGSGNGAPCAADGAQQYVGQQATQAVGGQIQAATGAEIFQWVPPDSAVTMDYRPNRVRVSYDRGMTITSIKCG